MKEFVFTPLSLCIFICNYFYIYWYKRKFNEVEKHFCIAGIFPNTFQQLVNGS